MECVLSTPELGQPQQNAHTCTQNPWHTNKNLEPKMQNWQKRGDEKTPKKKKKRARPHAHTKHKKHKKNHKTPESPRNTKTNHIQAPQQRAPHQQEQQCIISHKKKLIIERGCQERKAKKHLPNPQKRKQKRLGIGRYPPRVENRRNNETKNEKKKMKKTPKSRLPSLKYNN
jgi:hypothetical protein